MWGGGKICLLTLALTGLLASCTSKSKPPEPTPPPAPVIYTLTLDANGGILAQGTSTTTQRVTSGEKAQRPADPTHTDVSFTFAGWTKTRDGSDIFDFTTEPITAALTLYAKWGLKDSYVVDFDANGGSPAPSRQVVFSGEKAQKPADPARTGYTFGGWTKTRDGADAFDFDSETVTDYLTLYAKWDTIFYTLTFDANGGVLPQGTGAPQQVASGSRATRPAEPTRQGFPFLGWTRTKDGDDTFDFATETVTANLTLYAKWWYPVILDVNGGAIATGTNTAQQLASGDRVAPPANPTRAREGQWDFTFLYWSADKRTRFDFNAPVTQTTTLYAMWSVLLPDPVFRNELKTLVPSAFDGNRLVVSHADVTGLTYMDVSAVYASSPRIADLSGTEFFTALTTLRCYGNRLTVLDVSRNTALTTLYCFSNALTALDVSRNTALTELECRANQLTTLDVSRNTALTELNCSYNQLTALDVSRNTALTSLSCSYNQLTALDVSRNPALTSLDCNNNRLITLDVSRNTALRELNCQGNQLTALDVSGATALRELYCQGNQLTALDVSQNTALTTLYCGDNQLTALDVSRNTALTSLDCNNNRLITLDVSRNPALTSLDCINNQLTSLNVSGAIALTTLKCNNNRLITLDVSQNLALTRLYCQNNQLTTLDMRSITVVNFYTGEGSFLSLSNNPNLTLLKVNTSVKDNSEVADLKRSRGSALTIEVYDYTKTCSNYDPISRTCLTP